MNTGKRFVLGLLALLPIPSVSFAALENGAIDSSQLVQRGTRLQEMFDAGYFSQSFYDQMKNLGISKGADFYTIQDESLRATVREAVKKEAVQLAMAGAPSPT